VLPEPVLEPMPLVPLEPLVLPAPDGLLLLGEALEPVEPLEDDEPCSRRQRSFSEPVRVSHWVLPPRAGELVEEPPVALGEDPVEEELLPVALGELPLWDDESAAMTAVEAANSAARVAAERTFNIGALL
jgi:hypothetical protein